MKKALIAAGLLLVMAGIIGGALAYASVDGGDAELDIKLAPIHEVDVYIAESFPPQVMVHMQGGLSDGCTTLREIKTERNGNVIDIKVTTQRPGGGSLYPGLWLLRGRVESGQRLHVGRSIHLQC